MENLDINSLRSFVLFNQLGSLSLTADKVGRTQAAVSLQLKRLEDQLGCTLFNKSGRRIVLSGAGEKLLDYAQKIIQLNDVALNSVRTQLEGEVSLGLTQDLANEWLLPVFHQFKLNHPKVKINIIVESNSNLEKRYKENKLDMVILARKSKTGTPMLWVGTDLQKNINVPINLILFEGPCLFREMAIKNLKEAGIAFNITFTSSNLTAMWSAVRAGLGVTLRSSIGLPKDLVSTNRISHKAKKLGNIEFVIHYKKSGSQQTIVSLYEELKKQMQLESHQKTL